MLITLHDTIDTNGKIPVNLERDIRGKYFVTVCGYKVYNGHNKARATQELYDVYDLLMANFRAEEGIV